MKSTPANVLAVVTPHWSAKRGKQCPRLRAVIAGVFSMAKAKGWRKGDNPAAWADNLQHLLAKRSRSEETKHFRRWHTRKSRHSWQSCASLTWFRRAALSSQY